MTERELFIAALRLPDDHARVAFLEGACADERLRQQVESMLRDHEQLGSFLESPASPFVATVDHQAWEPPGTLIGPVLGAGVIVFLKNFVSVYTKRWLLILGAVYIGVILFAPHGIVGSLRRGRR